MRPSRTPATIQQFVWHSFCKLHFLCSQETKTRRRDAPLEKKEKETHFWYVLCSTVTLGHVLSRWYGFFAGCLIVTEHSSPFALHEREMIPSADLPSKHRILFLLSLQSLTFVPQIIKYQMTQQKQPLLAVLMVLFMMKTKLILSTNLFLFPCVLLYLSGLFSNSPRYQAVWSLTWFRYWPNPNSHLNHQAQPSI